MPGGPAGVVSTAAIVEVADRRIAVQRSRKGALHRGATRGEKF
jgi:hypothetical protein